ncbi:MAG: hypothetical protein HKP56_05255 [Anderseniella sp.]|nr:hypothetical protein [Anderseniella sp.]
MSHLEEELYIQLRSRGLLTGMEREYRFAAHAAGGPGKGLRNRLKDAGLKDWRFDFAWTEHKFAVEIEGGAFSGGRHTRGKGFTEDLEKYHHAMVLGWSVYRCSGPLIGSLQAVDLIHGLLTQLHEGAS